ncbi:flagellar biosynthesis protein FlgF, partial [Klebsiella pneumoniae]|nr:flagellar biosynthesis protein FlgF [Klebsiella pneumoniae]
NDEPGPLTPTGRNLDVAMQGKAWLAVQANDGTEAYTRAGSLDVSGEGLLVMRNGMPVLGDGGPINVPPNSQLSIGS